MRPEQQHVTAKSIKGDEIIGSTEGDHQRLDVVNLSGREGSMLHATWLSLLQDKQANFGQE